MIYDVTVYRLDCSRDATFPNTPPHSLLTSKALKPRILLVAFLLAFMFIAVTHQTCTRPLPHADNRCLVQTSGRQTGHMTGCCKGPRAAVNAVELPPRGRWENSPHLLEVNKIKYPRACLCGFRTACKRTDVRSRFYKGARAS